MKKFTVIIAILFAFVLSAKAESSTQFNYSVTADVVSDWIWRGMYNGGLSFQPGASVGVSSDNVSFDVSVWGNIGATNYRFEPTQYRNYYINPEFDIYINLDLWHFNLGLNHYWYCGKYFDDMKFIGDEAYDSQTEVYLGYDFSSILHSNNSLSLYAYTMILGGDFYINDDLEKKRAYSTYIELSYIYDFGDGISVNTLVGITPFKSFYTNYEGTFAFNNFSIKLEKVWTVGVTSMSVWGQLMINPYYLENYDTGKPILASIGYSFNL